jgi:hypothetical protein
MPATYSAQVTAPYPIKRKNAERLIVAYQLVQLARSGRSIICDYYADRGGPCPGLNGFSDGELRGIYRSFIEGIDRLNGEALLRAVAAFERSQLTPEHKTTCQLMASAGRLCDGFNRWTNAELAQSFEILRGRTVID